VAGKGYQSEAQAIEISPPFLGRAGPVTTDEYDYFIQELFKDDISLSIRACETPLRGWPSVTVEDTTEPGPYEIYDFSPLGFVTNLQRYLFAASAWGDESCSGKGYDLIAIFFVPYETDVVNIVIPHIPVAAPKDHMIASRE
jgi:hypothetical protein